MADRSTGTDRGQGLLEGAPITVARGVAVVPVFVWRVVAPGPGSAGAATVEPGAQPGAQPGGALETEPKAEPGAALETDPGAEPGGGPGSESGAVLEAEPIAVIVARTSGVERLDAPAVGGALRPRVTASGAHELDEPSRQRVLKAAVGTVVHEGEGEDEGNGKVAILPLRRVRLHVGKAGASGAVLQTKVACRIVAAGDSVSIEAPGGGR